MGAILSALVPAKNLNYGAVGAVLTVVLLALIHKFLGIDLASTVAALLSTPDSPVTSNTVIVTLAGAIGMLIAHAVDVKDNIKNISGQSVK